MSRMLKKNELLQVISTKYLLTIIVILKKTFKLETSCFPYLSIPQPSNVQHKHNLKAY